MLYKLNIYNRPFVILCLIAYIGGCFQSLVLESLHFASHTVDLIEAEYKYHTYPQHDESVPHTHDLLEVVAQNTDNDNTQDSPINQIKLKKKVEINDVLDWTLLRHTSAKSIQTNYIFQYQSIFLEILAPPPRRFSC